MAFEITGEVLLVQKEQQHSDRFRYRDLILLVPSNYPQEICIQFHNDKVDLLAGITPKSLVKIKFELRGKRDKHKDVWYNQIVGFDINKV